MDGLFTSSSEKKKLKAKKELQLKMANKETVATDKLEKDMLEEKEKLMNQYKDKIKGNALYIGIGVLVLASGYFLFFRNRKR